MLPEFKPWPKIPRLHSNGIIITEKIDGTNAQVFITDEEELYVGSRSRWITPDNDNYGFARFVYENEESFRKLGLGHHYGEWWGPGIQRGYNERFKIFSLFNVLRHDNVTETTGNERIRTVPILYRGGWSDNQIEAVMMNLQTVGSVASPGYLRPEGIVIYHHDSKQLFKFTLEGDRK